MSPDIDAVRARLRGRFIATARERLGRAGAASSARAELHALAGEASMMGEAELASQARAAEKLAYQWQQGDATVAAAVAEALQGLVALVDGLES